MLTPEARKLAEELGLHRFDYEWVARLPPEQQCATVRKCTAPTFNAFTEDRPKSRIFTWDGGCKPYEL